MSRVKLMLSVLVGVVLCALLAGCGSAGLSAAVTPSAAAATATPQPVLVVKVKTVTLARKRVQVLGDLGGKTLYYFKPDSSSTVTCTDSCAQLWPPMLLLNGTPTAGTTLTGHLNVVVGANGRQVLYNGHPLYTYARDGDAGDAYGQGVGGEWFVATPSLLAQS
jgi:predicted lipoprotein with Yx(FWY)xxD motif